MSLMKSLIIFSSLLALTTLFSSPACADQKIKYAGTFSSLEYHPESGDLAGEEIKIVWTRKGYQGAMQIAEGGPSELMLIKPTLKGNEITFSVNYEGDICEFKGTIDNNGIKGNLVFVDTGGEAVLNLKRKHSYWD